MSWTTDRLIAIETKLDLIILEKLVRIEKKIDTLIQIAGLHNNKLNVIVEAVQDIRTNLPGQFGVIIESINTEQDTLLSKLNDIQQELNPKPAVGFTAKLSVQGE
jgi:endonuclease III